MVEARKKKRWGGVAKRKRERFCFHQSVGGDLGGQEEDRNENSYYFLSSLPELDSNAKERSQGSAFSVLFCLASSGLGSSVRGAPHLVGIRLQKESW